MYETMTYEKILSDMLSRVSSDVDKREGSVIYDALAPCAFHLAETYFYLDNFADLVFGDTAIGEYLDRVVDSYGITRKVATYSTRTIVTNGPVDIGTRWGIQDLVYKITEASSTNVYKAQCETVGEIGNTYSGIMESVDNVYGITATLGDILIAGEDEETDDALRERFYEQIRTASTSGNVADYKKWSLEKTGVGGVKVFPLWNGPGTVKVVILDNDKQPVKSNLIEETYKIIEEKRPIGALVEVVSGTAKKINVFAIISLAAGYNLQEVNTTFKEALIEYFKSIAFELNYISYAKIGTILLGIKGVLDYSNLNINDTMGNITLSDEEVPILGTSDLEV